MPACLQKVFQMIDPLEVEYDPSQTNMVFVTLPEEAAGALQAYLKENSVFVASGRRVRLVTHLDVSEKRCANGYWSCYSSFFLTSERSCRV